MAKGTAVASRWASRTAGSSSWTSEVRDGTRCRGTATRVPPSRRSGSDAGIATAAAAATSFGRWARVGFGGGAPRAAGGPEERKGAGDPARGGSGGIFEDVTDSLAGGLPSSPTPFASAFEWLESRDAGPPDFHSEPSSRLAVGWNDGRVSVHRRRMRETGRSDLLLPGDDQSGWSWTELWSAREHAKRVTAVRWHPRAAEDDDDALFPGWLAAASKDGSFLVYDGAASWSARRRRVARR